MGRGIKVLRGVRTGIVFGETHQGIKGSTDCNRVRVETLRDLEEYGLESCSGRGFKGFRRVRTGIVFGNRH